MMTLKTLIEWLERQPADATVHMGFGEPHTDRGSYHDLAFDPAESATFGEMLEHARSALGKTFDGYKGGDYTMGAYSTVKIGDWGCVGSDIGPHALAYWRLTAGLAHGQAEERRDSGAGGEA